MLRGDVCSVGKRDRNRVCEDDNRFDPHVPVAESNRQNTPLGVPTDFPKVVDAEHFVKRSCATHEAHAQECD